MQLSTLSHSNVKKTLLLSLAALGVVYGDIGTSPLYAIKEILFSRALSAPTRLEIIGVISLVLWALTLVVAIKYVIFVLRADNDGEGGVFALYGLINDLGIKQYAIILIFLIIAAGLLFGDGIITPAISVISAVEGLTVVSQGIQPYVVPITVIILTALFVIQRKGTSRIGLFFGPVMLLWFICIAVLGVFHIVTMPEILLAINPYHALWFVTHHSVSTLMLVLGNVMLVITGGEAMYADMGHFGKLPIRIGWYTVTYPALLLNYLGQGAYLLSGKPIHGETIFFSMVPSWGVVPMVFLATIATVIASQALISGAFSLTTQAISLGIFPYISVNHTNVKHSGQIYVPFINWVIYAGAVALVIAFGSSTKLAGAYGLAVSGVMFITTLSMLIVVRKYWHWNSFIALLLILPFLAIDYVFLISNSAKFFEGGFIPVVVGIIVLILARTWQWGRKQVAQTFKNYQVMKVSDLIALKDNAHIAMPKIVVIMTPQTITSLEDNIPPLKQIFWERFGILPHDLIFLKVSIKKVPHVRNRYTIYNLYKDKKRGSITSVIVNFGFMENPNVEKTLEGLQARNELPVNTDYKTWLIHVIHERVFDKTGDSVFGTIRFILFSLMQRNSDSADQYFGLGQDQPLTVEVLPVHLS